MKTKRNVTPRMYYLSVSFILIVIIGAVDIITFHYQYTVINDLKNIWLNIHTSVVEVFLLGYFVIAYTKLEHRNRERKDNIERWQEEIEDYREWDEKEATYRLRGLIRRLNKEGVVSLKLSGAFLQRLELNDANLEHSDLSNAHLEEAWLIGTNLRGANLSRAYLNKTFIWRADLKFANMEDAHLEDVYLSSVFFEGARIDGAFVDTPDWFDKLKEARCIGVDELEAKYYVSEERRDGNIEFRVRKKK